MAAIHSIRSGYWNDALTWNSGLPTNSLSCVVAHTIMPKSGAVMSCSSMPVFTSAAGNSSFGGLSNGRVGSFGVGDAFALVSVGGKMLRLSSVGNVMPANSPLPATQYIPEGQRA